MTTSIQASSDVRRALQWGVPLAGLWLIVALARPETTFHLAPFLIAAAPPILLVLDDRTLVDRPDMVRVALGALAIAAVATIAVSAVGAMQGPAFEAFGTPVVEAVVFALFGGVVGFGFAWWRTR